MADIARVSVRWQGWPGAPGVSQLYTDPSGMQTTVNTIRVFYDAIKAQIPTALTITVPATGDVIDDQTGAITGSWTVTTPPTDVVCSGVGVYAGNAGAVVHWLTTGIVRGRRVRGRTFIVPLVGSAYDAAGSLSTTALNLLATSATSMVNSLAPNLKVWHRPGPLGAGQSYGVTSSRVPDLAVSLRSRRV